MDCGEGTFGQLIRHFGFVRTEEILARTNIIFISHLHADHHLGLISLLKFRRKAVQKFDSCLQKVFLVAPKPMVFWLHKYQNLFEEILSCIHFISNEDLVCFEIVYILILQFDFGMNLNKCTYSGYRNIEIKKWTLKNFCRLHL